MTFTLRPFAVTDVAVLRAIYNGLVAPAPGWTAAEAMQAWGVTDPARRALARVAARDGRVLGGVGVVPLAPWLYVFPLIAAELDVATALLATALGHASAAGIQWVRVGVRAGEDAKRAALGARGFTRSIDLIDLVRGLDAPAAVAPAPAGPRRVALAELDRDRLRALHDRTFDGVPNGGPISPGELAAALDGPEAWPAATAVWADATGSYVGFVLALRGRDARGGFAKVDAIGVDAPARGRGLARRMLADLLAAAGTARLGEVRAIVASTNPASLALHLAAGFVEEGRREMWDLDR